MNVSFDKDAKRLRIMRRIDEVDRRILALLEHDGRISNKKLANAVGVSQSTCLERVRRLERAGVVRGYHACIAPEFRRARFEVWATIRLLGLPVTTQRSLYDLIAASAYVVAVVQMTGAFDFLIHFACEEASAWRAFCGELSSIGVCADRLSFGVVTEDLAREGR